MSDWNKFNSQTLDGIATVKLAKIYPAVTYARALIFMLGNHDARKWINLRILPEEVGKQEFVEKDWKNQVFIDHIENLIVHKLQAKLEVEKVRIKTIFVDGHEKTYWKGNSYE
jgi:hypothetical protein